MGYRRTLPLIWSADMAYIVGLTATDGCLYTGLRKVNFKSADRELVATYLRVLGRTNPIKTKTTRKGGVVHLVQFGDAELYRWLLTIGLTPRKSLTLGAIDTPDEYVAHLLRGLFDGDGSIRTFVHKPTPSTYPNYAYERLWVFFNTASRTHVDWLLDLTSRLFGTHGYIEVRPADEKRHEFYRLKFGKRDSMTILRAMYPHPNVPMLERKWAIWIDYARRHEIDVC